MGEIKEYNGTLKVGANIKIGYLPQKLEFENDKLSILDYYKGSTSKNEFESRSILAKFKFYDDLVYKKIKDLSGGEKIRLKLSVLLQKQINMIIFDEPTNHIDIQTREILEETLKDFKGPLLFVSHDRYFINSVCNKTIEIENYELKETSKYKKEITNEVL